MLELGDMSSDSYVVLSAYHVYRIRNMLSLCILPLEGLKVIFLKLSILAIFTSKYMFSSMLILNIEVKIWFEQLLESYRLKCTNYQVKSVYFRKLKETRNFEHDILTHRTKIHMVRSYYQKLSIFEFFALRKLFIFTNF